MKTAIKRGTVIAFDKEKHTVVPIGEVVFEDDRIIYVGEEYKGSVDQVIDAKGMLVSPGLIDTHCHVTDTPFTRGWLEDYGQRDFSSVYTLLPAIRAVIGIEDQLAAAECSFVQLLLSGTTTVFEMGYDAEIMDGNRMETTNAIADMAGRLGIRAYIGPRYRSMYYYVDTDGSVGYEIYPGRGVPRFEDCLQFVKEYKYGHLERVIAALTPGQANTCDPELLRATRKAANELEVPIQIHAGQTPQEFRDIKRRYGKTTIEYLAETGLLRSDLILGHGVWLSEDGDVDRYPSTDLNLLATSGTSIAHCPYVKARYGTLMNSFAKYRRNGINVSLGTDTNPQDMVHEMRWAAIGCKLAEGNPQTGIAQEIFHAATVGGAQALGRQDLGRLSTGCKADIVLFNLRDVDVIPIRDPFNHLVFNASGRDVTTVVVDGQTVVENRRVPMANIDSVVNNMEEAARRVWGRLRFD